MIRSLLLLSLASIALAADAQPASQPAAVTIDDLQAETVEVRTLYETPEPTLNNYAFDTPVAHYDGCTYFIWRAANESDRRPRVVKVDAAGAVTTEFLDPREDYFGSTDLHNTFSLGIDRDGYIHVVGDMHYQRRHEPPDNPLPERYRDAGIMYWVSDRPGDITSFTFLGHDAERAIPLKTSTYYAFHCAPDRTLYYHARSSVLSGGQSGRIGLGLCRYDPDAKRWTELGADPPADGREVRNKAVLWELGGHSDVKGAWYQHCMTAFRLDLQGRLHLGVNWNADPTKNLSTHVVYARSDDCGRTWQRADGSPIAPLPMRIAPGSSQADVVTGPIPPSGTFQMAAYVTPDASGRPLVSYEITREPWYQRYFSYWQPDAGRWSEPKPLPWHSTGAAGRGTMGYLGPDSVISYPIRKAIVRTLSHDGEQVWHKVPVELSNVDAWGVLTSGVIRGLHRTDCRWRLVEVRFPPAGR